MIVSNVQSGSGSLMGCKRYILMIVRRGLGRPSLDSNRTSLVFCVRNCTLHYEIDIPLGLDISGKRSLVDQVGIPMCLLLSKSGRKSGQGLKPASSSGNPTHGTSMNKPSLTD